jgi:hypothetical protein
MYIYLNTYTSITHVHVKNTIIYIYYLFIYFIILNHT